jgi:hypothetical protein
MGDIGHVFDDGQSSSLRYRSLDAFGSVALAESALERSDEGLPEVQATTSDVPSAPWLLASAVCSGDGGIEFPHGLSL